MNEVLQGHDCTQRSACPAAAVARRNCSKTHSSRGEALLGWLRKELAQTVAQHASAVKSNAFEEDQPSIVGSYRSGSTLSQIGTGSGFRGARV